MQRGDSTIAAPVSESLVADPAEAASVSTPPGMEPVTRTKREPAKATPAPKPNSEAKSKAASPAPERHVSWRPERIVASPYRPRPPCPAGTVGEPATVV